MKVFMDGYNTDITEEQKTKLKQLFPEVFIEDKINWDKLKATLGEEVDLGEKYGLNWKGKSSVFAKIQEKTTSTLHPQPEESVDWDTTQNMFIEGDNLEALKVLHKSYYGKIKMIYIDPPYNTGNDFVYNDDFKKTQREQALEDGLIDEEGNVTRDDGLCVNAGGHKHSNWLDMMYPRLFLARNLLRQDGVIFVSIDDNEVHNLRLMMNEIFGEENFVGQISIKSTPGGKQASTNISSMGDYLLVYSRTLEASIPGIPLNKEQIKKYNLKDDKGSYLTGRLRQHGIAERREDVPTLYFPIYFNESTQDITTIKKKGYDIEVLPILPAGGDGRWIWSREKIERDKEYIQIRQINRNGTLIWDAFFKKYYNDSMRSKLPSIMLDKDLRTEIGSKGLRELFDGAKYFDYPKPVYLIKKLLSSLIDDDFIVLDFFSGSGTLAHAVNELNAEDGGSRQWIMVQLPELTEEKSEAYKAGYKTIAEIARERIRRAGSKINKDFADKITERKTSLDLGFRSYILGDSNFKKWNELVADPEEIKQQTLESLNPIEDGAKDEDLLTEILLKRGISPLVKMEKHEDFIFVPSETLAISLSCHMTEELFNKILAKSLTQIIILDQAFKDDVNLKTNLVLQAEKKNIGIEVI